MKTRAKVDLAQAEKEIRYLFQQYGCYVDKSYNKFMKGKIYELYCLSRVIERLKQNKFKISIRTQSRSIDFKASPGKIDRNKSYFIVNALQTSSTFEIHTDIEIMAMEPVRRSQHMQEHKDRSACHEIDIVAIYPNLSGRPRYDKLILGVECKSDVHFRKSILKQILGIRRILSLHRKESLSLLAKIVGRNSPIIRACPRSEYWLAYVDPKGDNYKHNPSLYDIKFHHWCP